MYSIYRSVPLKKQFRHLTVEQIENYPVKKLNEKTTTRDDLYCWNKSKGRPSRGFGSAESLTQFLNEEIVRAENIINDFAKRKKALTADSFRHAFKKSNVDMSIFDYCQQHWEVDQDCSLAPETIKSYMSIIGKLERYKPGLRMEEIDNKFLTKYVNWMKKEKPKMDGGKILPGNGERTINNNLKVIRTALLMAIKNDDFLVEHYPFNEYKVGETQTELTSRDFLEPEEILQMEDLLNAYYPPSKPVSEVSKNEWKERAALKILNPGEYDTLRNFLFACYTGLRYKDMFYFNVKEHVKGKWVKNPMTHKRTFRYYVDVEEMHKTGKMLIVPLIDKALGILDMDNKGKEFRVISNQKTNKHLKFIAKLAGINKKLSFHVARHTFATTCFTYGIPAEVGQKLLGHKSDKFIKIYTHLTQNTLFVEMEKVNKGFNEYEQLLRVVHTSSDSSVTQSALSKKLEDEKFRELVDALGKMDKKQIEKVAAIAKVVTAA
ncbi:MAG TPA: tyrosine-type recombinase/integrase [Bacteroidia bacterium]|nr:tyrosine-type recombinase/integrase [Bacteroidia bacterium]